GGRPHPSGGADLFRAARRGRADGGGREKRRLRASGDRPSEIPRSSSCSAVGRRAIHTDRRLYCPARHPSALDRRRGAARTAAAVGVPPFPMIHLTRSLVRRWLDQLLHIHDTPERTAAAFALGVFLGFSPFLGFHTILGIALAFLLNLNRVAVLLGVY